MTALSCAAAVPDGGAVQRVQRDVCAAVLRRRSSDLQGRQLAIPEWAVRQGHCGTASRRCALQIARRFCTLIADIWQHCRSVTASIDRAALLLLLRQVHTQRPCCTPSVALGSSELHHRERRHWLGCQLACPHPPFLVRRGCDMRLFARGLQTHATGERHPGLRWTGTPKGVPAGVLSRGGPAQRLPDAHPAHRGTAAGPGRDRGAFPPCRMTHDTLSFGVCSGFRVLGITW